jgi:dTDP-4-amino-4,6-dideoxygalactose transaminase
VHYAGVACEMDTILDIARRYGLRVVEDAAQGVNASYKGRWLGTLGDLGCHSFHETKNFSSGEGGALVVNDTALERRAEIIREKGTNRSQFLRGQVDKYSWVDVGSSYVPSDLLAAFLLGQLEHMERITERRAAIYHRYAECLAPLARDGRLGLPTVPAECRSNYHMFYVLTADIEERSALIEHLKAAGIQAVFHYVPLHSSVVGARLGTASAQLPVTDRVSAGLVRLPMFYDLSDSEVDEVCEAVAGFFRERSSVSASG